MSPGGNWSSVRFSNATWVLPSTCVAITALKELISQLEYRTFRSPDRRYATPLTSRVESTDKRISMRLPATIGKYWIEEFLGGGMAEVYRAEDTVLGRQVAFKQLSPAGMADEHVRARFLEEAKVGGQLSHDNIVRTLDYGVEDGQPFIVMELLRGASLGAHIKAGDLGDFTSRARIALEMARALGYLHR